MEPNEHKWQALTTIGAIAAALLLSHCICGRPRPNDEGWSNHAGDHLRRLVGPIDFAQFRPHWWMIDLRR